MLSRLPWALLAALAAACTLATPSWAASSCGWSGYSYAGVQASQAASGISARLTAVRNPRVQNGHVAAWVGVGGSGLGPNGADEWLQVGLSALPGSGSKLYYEFAQPGTDAKYVMLDGSIAAGTSHRVAVLEVRGRPGVWRAWVDGTAVTRPIYLPGSHSAWAPIATAESWDGGVPSCNAYAYRFDSVSLATRPGGDWQRLRGGRVMQDPGYRVLASAPGTFVAGRR